MLAAMFGAHEYVAVLEDDLEVRSALRNEKKQ